MGQKNFTEVVAITFNYGQRHTRETEIASSICDRLQIPIKVIDITNLMVINKSALISNDTDINELRDDGLPSSFVPNRNQIFLTLAHTLAITIGADTVVTGVCETDFSGYPDCREVFIKSLEHTSNIGSGSNIKFVTPLMFLDKAETFRLAKELGCLDVILEETLTCYNGDETMNTWGKGCGNCPSCKLRENGFKKFVESYGI